MNALDKLIKDKQKVIVSIIDENENQHHIEGIILNYDLNDFYFHDKGEPLYLNITVKPTEKLPNGITYEHFHSLSLEDIRKV